MSILTINRLTDSIGAEVVGVDADHLLNDDSLPDLHGLVPGPGCSERGQQHSAIERHPRHHL